MKKGDSNPVPPEIQAEIDALAADLIDWFKTQATQEEGYQTSINRALREYVETRAKK